MLVLAQLALQSVLDRHCMRLLIANTLHLSQSETYKKDHITCTPPRGDPTTGYISGIIMS